MCADTSNHFIECARIYIVDWHHGGFIIKCFICQREFKDWTRFADHMKIHGNLKKFPETTDALHTQDGNKSGNKLSKKLNLSTETKIPNTERVLLAKMPKKVASAKVANSAEKLKSKALYKNCTINSSALTFETLIDFKVELIDAEYTNDDNSYTETESEAAVDIVYTEKHSDNYNNYPNTSKYLDQRTPISQENYSRSNSHRKSSVNEPFPMSRNCFFQLRRTDPHVILTFIDVMQKHPCQWNMQDTDYELKEKRDESSKEICKELKKMLNIDLSPQLARSSVRYLCRWFEREYLRVMKCNKKQMHPKTGRWGRSGYVCAHPEYFQKLLKFLPHEHLKFLSCEKCRRIFKTERQWLAHQHQIHGGEMPYKCEYCKRSFLYQSSLRHHVNRHTKERLWYCKLCDYTSVSKTDFHLHRVTHTDIRAYVCDLCGASYKSSTSLKVHIRTHEPPRLACLQCGKKFYENYRLKRHMWIHQAESSAESAVTAGKPEFPDLEKIISTNIARTFEDKYSAQRYGSYDKKLQVTGSANCHAMDNKTNDFDCTLCGLAFNNLNVLRDHASSEHAIIIL